MDEGRATPLTRRVVLGLSMGGLLLLSYIVLRLFLVPLAWAGILAYVTWPLYRRLRNLLRGGATGSALLMTVLLIAAFVLPVVWLVALLRDEPAAVYHAVADYLAQGRLTLPDFVARLPWLGDRLQEFLARVAGDPELLKAELALWSERWGGQLAELVGDVGRNALKLGISLLAVFFFYRDGESLIHQLRHVLRRFLGDRINAYLHAVGATVRAVVYGLLLTALAQGTLAGVGYWVAGINAPILLGALTALLALIPFGAVLVWGSLGVWLILTGSLGAGIGLLAWGALAVSWVDNLVRPLVISSATRIPFLLVLFGVAGGLVAFGLVGLFVGPVILAVLMAVWREWLEESDAQAGPGKPAD